jgi:hypothetical protein
MTTNQLYNAACDIADRDTRFAVLALIEQAWANADENEYTAADLDSDGAVNPEAWERRAAGSLALLVGDNAAPETLAWFESQEFSR